MTGDLFWCAEHLGTAYMPLAARTSSKKNLLGCRWWRSNRGIRSHRWCSEPSPRQVQLLLLTPPCGSSLSRCRQSLNLFPCCRAETSCMHLCRRQLHCWALELEEVP